MNTKTLITPILTSLAWVLTVILVMQLLGGNFDTRSCTTTCVQILYWAAFVVTFVALLIGGLMMRDGYKDLLVQISLGLSAVLMVIFLTTMAIGTFLY